MSKPAVSAKLEIADKARSATDTVIGSLKEKLPSTVASQLDSVAGGGSSNLGDMAKGIGAKFTGRA